MTTDLTTFTSAPLDQRVRYAEQLANAGDLIPRGLRDQRGNPVPGKILLVAETGSMLGMHPIAALQGVNIIDGKPTISPALMSAVVRRAGHKLRVTTRGSVQDRSFEATATLIRSDDPDHPFTATWNGERAQRAGLVNKKNWQNYFEAMCKARAISEVCREGAEDALMGVGYVPEELGAEVDEEGNIVGAAPEPARAAQAAAVAATSSPVEPVDADRDWPAEIAAAETVEALKDVYAEIPVASRGQEFDGKTVNDLVRERKAELEAASQPEPLVPEPAAAPAQDWLAIARGLSSEAELRALLQEAQAQGASEHELQGIGELAADVSRQAAASADWAGSGDEAPQWVAPGEGLKRAEEER